MAWCHMPNNMEYVAAVYTACVNRPQLEVAPGIDYSSLLGVTR